MQNHLDLMADRATAFRAAIAAAPSLDVQVPTCPDWTLHDLAEHIGQGRRSWAATVTAGATATGRIPDTDPAPTDRDALLTWLTESTTRFADALTTAGPDAPVWTWWADSQSPQTAAAVARHQLQQMTVHTYDAQLANGDAQPLPEQIALDGVEEFLHTCIATTSAWPHQPATLAFRTTEGPAWYLRLTADGAHADTTDQPADATVTGTASELVLLCYDRLPLDALKVDGNTAIFEQLITWEPA